MANPYDKVHRMETLKLSKKEKQLVVNVLSEAFRRAVADGGHQQDRVGVLRAVLNRLEW